MRTYNRRYYEKNWLKLILKNIKRRAKRKGIEFSIIPDDLIIPSHCPIFGTKLVINTGKTGADSPSIDRIDSDKGYIPCNVVIISHRANTIKSSGTAKEHQLIVDWLNEQII